MNKYELESLGFSKDMKIFMPWSHDLWRSRSNDLGSIEREAHCCLCGGQLFIIFQVENGVRKIIEKRF
jgi:hypothetical protein